MVTYVAKNRRIAEQLGERIRTGELLPGTKFDSIRHLARNFNVSQKVIMDAMDILNQQGLINRRPRSGILVKDTSPRKKTEVVILIPDTPSAYISRMLEIMTPEQRESGIEFTCRTLDYQKNTGENFFRQISIAVKELHPDCILLNAPKFREVEIHYCEQLKIPVIFIGDFAKPELIHSRVFQVTSDNYTVGANAVEGLNQMNCSKAVYLYGENDFYFYREALRGFRETAEARKLQCFAYKIPHGFSDKYLPEIKSVIDDFLQESSKAGFDSVPVVDLGYYADLFYHYGRGLQNRIYVPHETEKSKQAFFRQIYHMIRYAVSNPQSQKSVVNIPEFELQQYGKGI